MKKPTWMYFFGSFFQELKDIIYIQGNDFEQRIGVKFLLD